MTASNWPSAAKRSFPTQPYTPTGSAISSPCKSTSLAGTPLDLTYFEKRNTSTLEPYWLTPGEEGGLNFVPPSAFAHRSG